MFYFFALFRHRENELSKIAPESLGLACKVLFLYSARSPVRVYSVDRAVDKNEVFARRVYLTLHIERKIGGEHIAAVVFYPQSVCIRMRAEVDQNCRAARAVVGHEAQAVEARRIFARRTLGEDEIFYPVLAQSHVAIRLFCRIFFELFDAVFAYLRRKKPTRFHISHRLGDGFFRLFDYKINKRSVNARQGLRVRYQLRYVFKKFLSRHAPYAHGVYRAVGVGRKNIDISDIVRAAERIKLTAYAANDRICEPDAVNGAEHLSRSLLAVTYGYRPHFYIIKHAANPARRSGKIAADIIIFRINIRRRYAPLGEAEIPAVAGSVRNAYCIFALIFRFFRFESGRLGQNFIQPAQKSRQPLLRPECAGGAFFEFFIKSIHISPRELVKLIAFTL